MSGFPPTASLKDADKEIAAARNPKLRLLVVEHKSSDFPLHDITTNLDRMHAPRPRKTFSAVSVFLWPRHCREGKTWLSG